MTKKASLALAFAVGLLLAANISAQDGGDRSAYSYIRMMTGEATVNSRLNGEVEGRRNMPISVGDEISVSQAGRVEVGLADGNTLFLGGGTRAAFDSIAEQQGEEGEFSAIRLIDGELVLFALAADENRIPRVDTDDATIYVSLGTHVRVNADSRRGTVVVGRAGSAEVRTRTGTYTVKAGQYMMVRGDEEPEITRGAFSRDRFDLWVADRLDTLGETRSASVRYVGDQYANDVASLDGYGDWDYDSGYGGYVWSPRVDADWSPYSYGNWYYTPVGMTWWSYDPWGWYPFHYGNWFYARSRWCWAPGHAYSPAWVYWGYSGGYVGWCPVGYYSYHSPWWNAYSRYWGGHSRSGLYFAINGSFPTHGVDLRGWNFVNSGSLGATVTRASVIPGSRIGDRLGSSVAITSRPIVVNTREGGTREAIRAFVREAPRTIERAAGPDSTRLAPVLARERVLPADTVEALRERTVVAERGRLAGPAAAEIAPRGAVVERSRTTTAGVTSREAISRETAGIDRRSLPAERGIAPAEPVVRDRAPVAGPAARISPRVNEDSWRTRGGAIAGEAREAPAARGDVWRSRSDVPPAQRVIEGAVPGHRAPEAWSGSPRGRESRSVETAPRERVERAPVEQRPPYSARPPARFERPSVERSPHSPPAVRMERPSVERSPYSPPAVRMSRPSVERSPYSPPAVRIERPSVAPAPPVHVERAPYSPPPARVERAPESVSPPRVERAPAPAPAQAPAPRAEGRHESAPRSAPAQHPERGRPN
jgi:hypothetical protein